MKITKKKKDNLPSQSWEKRDVSAVVELGFIPANCSCAWSSFLMLLSALRYPTRDVNDMRSGWPTRRSNSSTVMLHLCVWDKCMILRNVSLYHSLCLVKVQRLQFRGVSVFSVVGPKLWNCLGMLVSLSHPLVRVKWQSSKRYFLLLLQALFPAYLTSWKEGIKFEGQHLLLFWIRRKNKYESNCEKMLEVKHSELKTII